MMRLIPTVVGLVGVACSTMAFAQDANTTLPPEFFTAQQIAEGAARSFAELEARVKELEAENAALKAKPCDCGCECGKAKQAPTAKLVMVSMPGCPACDLWWSSERLRYEASGWSVEHTSEQPKRGKLYPYWRLCIGDQCTEISWLPFSQLDDRVRALIK